MMVVPDKVEASIMMFSVAVTEASSRKI